MKILVTGNAGMIGQVVEKVLRDDGHEVIGFDIKNGQDILNQQQVRDYSQGCDAVVHLAALLGYPEESANDIMAVNLLGTWGLELLSQYGADKLWRNLAQTLQHELRVDTYNHLQELELAYFEDRSTGTLLSFLMTTSTS